MGENLALNIASRGYSIAVYNRTTSVTDAFIAGRGDQPNVVGCHTLGDLVASLKSPRKVMMMVRLSASVCFVNPVLGFVFGARHPKRDRLAVGVYGAGPANPGRM